MLIEADVIADKFASHFTSVFSCNDPQKANSIEQDYVSMRANYCGLPLDQDLNIDTSTPNLLAMLYLILHMERP